MHAEPPSPFNISIANKMYGKQDLNVSITWDLFADRIDGYQLTTSAGNVMSVMQNHTANIINIPYNTNVTTEISTVVCGVQSTPALFLLVVSK